MTNRRSITLILTFVILAVLAILMLNTIGRILFNMSNLKVGMAESI